LVEFIDIQRPQGPFGERGPCPDPLTDRLPTTMPAGRPTTCWFTLTIPPDAAPGEYTGRLELVSGDESQATVPLTLTVWPFTLPARTSLDVHSAFRAELALAREHGEPEAVLQRYYQSFFTHRTTCQPGVAPRGLRDGDRITGDQAPLQEHNGRLRDTIGRARVTLPSLWISHRGTHQMPADAAWQGLRIFGDETITTLDPAFETAFRGYFQQVCDAFRGRVCGCGRRCGSSTNRNSTTRLPAVAFCCCAG